MSLEEGTYIYYVYIYIIYIYILCIYIYIAGRMVRTCGNFPKRSGMKIVAHLEPLGF